jgi:cyclophilin family peptidyl-prolyl cis-trans isomerase
MTPSILSILSPLLLGPAAVPLAPPPALLLQEEQDPEALRRQKEQAIRQEEGDKLRATRALEAKEREAEAAAAAQGVAAAAASVLTLDVSPNLVVAGASVLLTISRFETPETARLPILPNNVVLLARDGSEKRLDPRTPQKPAPPDPSAPGQVRRTFDLGPTLATVTPGLVQVYYDQNGVRVGPRQVLVFREVKDLNPDAVDLSTIAAILETDKGSMFVEFSSDRAPKTVRNFVKLVAQKFYDGMSFYRIKKGAFVQTGEGKRYPFDAPVPAEFNNLPHRKGILAMGRRNDPNSATCHFFVVHGSHLAYLDQGYAGENAYPTTAFAQVHARDFAVLDALASVPVGPNPDPPDNGAETKPVEPPRIKRIALVEKLGPVAPVARPAQGPAARPVTPPATPPAGRPARPNAQDQAREEKSKAQEDGAGAEDVRKKQGRP